MKSHETAVLLASGGLDSTTMAYWMLSEEINFIPLFFDYGQHCVDTEFDTLSSVLPPSVAEQVVRLDISGIYKGSNSRMIDEADLWTDTVEAEDLYIPYRNLLFLSIGAAYAQSHGLTEVYTAFINSNHAKEIDCSADFFKSLGGLLAEYGQVSVKMPFRNMSKLEVAQLAKNLGVSIGMTYSCQASSKVACGACPNCVDRLDALQSLAE